MVLDYLLWMLDIARNEYHCKFTSNVLNKEIKDFIELYFVSIESRPGSGIKKLDFIFEALFKTFKGMKSISFVDKMIS